MTARMYYDNDAESSGGRLGGAQPPTSERHTQLATECAAEGQGR